MIFLDFTDGYGQLCTAWEMKSRCKPDALTAELTAPRTSTIVTEATSRVNAAARAAIVSELPTDFKRNLRLASFPPTAFCLWN
jgi:hypothetical protein